MDPVTIATTVLSICWEKGFEKFAEDVGTDAWPIMKKCVSKLRVWLSSRASLREPAIALQKNPEDPKACAQMTAALTEEMKRDSHFAAELEEIAKSFDSNSVQINKFLGAVGKVVNVGTMSGGVINVN